jgi:hypothetical protein
MTAPSSAGPLLGWAAGVLKLAAASARARGPLAVITDVAPLPEPLAAALARIGGDAFDAAVLGLALAADLDDGHEATIAFLHNDVRRRGTSAGLLVRLCCPDDADRAAGLARLVADGPLAQRGLLRIDGAGATAEVRPGRAVVRHVLGLPEPAPEIAAACTPAVALPVGGHNVAVAAWAAAPEGEILHLHGVDADVLVARAAAALLAAGRRAMRVDLAPLDPSLASAVAAECLLRGLPALLVLPSDGHPALGLLLRTIDTLCVADPAHALARVPEIAALRPVVSVQLGPLTVAERADAVAARLARHGSGLTAPDAAVPFARRYRLGPEGVERVAAVTAARMRAEGREAARPGDLLDVAAGLAGGPLRDLATRVEHSARWEDLAVPDGVREHLAELCARVDVRDVVLDELGYGATIAGARGVTALFAGPSGAGKTLAASVVAGELGLALYRVDLARIVSKYIGETERNLDAVFAAAESTDVVLLFDEADALFGRRSEVADAHDRYANLEVAYLLQRMEAYDGVAILSTNLLRNLDDAFTRRLDFRVLFPFPGEAERRRIWRLVWPDPAALADDVDLDALAAGHELSGGTIRNAALAAAHLAAADGVPVGARHLDHAVAREHEKVGRLPRLVTGVAA